MSDEADAARVLRDAEIAALRLLDGDMPDALTPIARAAAITAGASGAEINIIDDAYQHTVVSAYDSPGRGPADESYCASIVLEPALVHHVPDARIDPRFADKPVTRSGQIRSYAAVQLVTSNKSVIGTICVFDPADIKADDQTLQVLTALADSAMVLIETRRRALQRRQTLEVMTLAVGELRRDNSQLAAFAAEVSTDLRGPLSALLFSLQLLAEDGHGDRGDRGAHGDHDERDERLALVGRALNIGQLMSTTVAGMLSHLGSDGHPSPELIATDDLVRDTATTLGIPETELDVSPLPELWGDKVQIGLVVRALLANAVQHGRAGAGVRVIGTRSHRGARISISDNGPGVAEHMRFAIFRPFAGGDSTQAGVVGVRGSGLATCRNIVTAHKGSLGVDEAPSGGACFWFELPNPPWQDALNSPA